jgi:hypothetical protein
MTTVTMRILFVLVLALAACSRGKPPPSAESPECYSTAAATACPADATDPSGKGLPTGGSACRLEPCRACGSATAPAFRDRSGLPQPGFCICVPRSDDSGATYSCFGVEEWRQRH